jgi:hypothetical protein
LDHFLLPEEEAWRLGHTQFSTAAELLTISFASLESTKDHLPMRNIAAVCLLFSLYAPAQSLSLNQLISYYKGRTDTVSVYKSLATQGFSFAHAIEEETTYQLKDDYLSLCRTEGKVDLVGYQTDEATFTAIKRELEAEFERASSWIQGSYLNKSYVKDGIWVTLIQGFDYRGNPYHIIHIGSENEYKG